MANYRRLIGNKGVRDDGTWGRKTSKLLAAKVWRDVNRTMSPRRPGLPGYFSPPLPGGGGYVCPVHFAGRSKYAVFRCANNWPTYGVCALGKALL